MLVRLFGADPGTWAAGEDLLGVACTVGGGLWLIVLIALRAGKAAGRRHLLLALAVGALTTVDLADRTGLTARTSSVIPWNLATTILLVWLVREVVHRHGITLPVPRLRAGRARSGRGFLHACAVSVSAVALYVVTGFVMLLLLIYASGPVLHDDQLSVMGLDSPLLQITKMLWSSVTEELVLTGAVVL
ncbi:hypothetical protein ACFU99_03575, partial [Streptomyces sp. NPDC057654]|uniref:hypothetical protein n=1 Tax=Streptomyces sp. NPDC057654 TaxID=3346196 RepID=UPI00367F6BB0